MKPPEEIKKGLECCSKPVGFGTCPNTCPFGDDEADEIYNCTFELSRDALAYITQLEQRLAQAERERDAAVHDISEASCFQCRVCKHGDWPNCKKGLNNVVEDDVCKCEFFEWRGVCEENSKESSHDI